MNVENIKRLENEQKKGLYKCQAKIDEWEKFKRDYEDLQQTLGTLPDKVNYDIMVPLGSLALLPGKLIHTNEILVLLGDNWFAERSCKQACEIVNRRLNQCEDTLKKLNEEKKQFTTWLDITSEMEKQSGEYVEIIEEYDPEKEKKWREQHRGNVQKYKQQQKKERDNFNLQEYLNTLEDDEKIHEDEVKTDLKAEESTPHLLNKDDNELTKLALEMASGPSKASGDNSGTSHNRGRRVSWHDEAIVFGGDDSSDSTDSSESSSPLVIHFHHSANDESSVKDDDSIIEDNQIIKSPADIYVHFSSWCQKIPKSILKPSVPVPKQHDLETIPSSQIVISSQSSSSRNLHSQPTAFSDLVVERETKEVLCPSSTNRPTSRFKAQKLASLR